eukprot:SAG31_NODE_70_length_28117_cov_100.521843_20_plen_42_part_00
MQRSMQHVKQLQSSKQRKERQNLLPLPAIPPIARLQVRLPD